MKKIVIIFLCYVFLFVYSFSQSSKKDSLRTYSIDAVVVTADKVENIVSNTTASVSVLTAKDMQSYPVQKVSDVFTMIPGFFVYNRDGIGREPIVNTRGFYGGGEAEYVQVLVDGKQVNDLETGLVNWNLVPLHSISCIEVSRGGSSPLYGDAALGGVVNIITRKDNPISTDIFINGGSFNSYSAGVKRSGLVVNQPYQLFFSNEKTKGYREHSDWEGTTFGGDIFFGLSSSATLKLSGVNQWAVGNDPGTLTSLENDTDPKYSSPYFKADGSNDRRNQLQAQFTNTFSDGGEFMSKLFYNHKASNIIRTFTNPVPILDQSYQIVGLYDTSDYGDTKERDLTTNEEGLGLSYNNEFNIGDMTNRVLVGSDLNTGNARSLYFTVFGGFKEDYENAEPARNNPALVNGAATRQKYALYFSNELQLSTALKLTLGLRWDRIHDEYDGDSPDTLLSNSSTAVSPKVGLNYHFINTEKYSGSIYASYNRSFKAPTIDQLSDQRSLDTKVYFPGYGFISYPVSPFSNIDLKPQRSSSYEIGMYHRLTISDDLSGEWSLAVFQMDMEDEIDFDLSTLRYQNIQESRHQGIETGFKFYWMNDITAFVNYTWNNVKFTAGPNDGNFLKGIPQHVASLGIAYHAEMGVTASVTWNMIKDMYLGDDNTDKLSDYDPVSAKISYKYSPFNIFVEGNNIFNQKFASTGYTLNGVTYLYPAAGASIRTGVEIDF